MTEDADLQRDLEMSEVVELAIEKFLTSWRKKIRVLFREYAGQGVIHDPQTTYCAFLRAWERPEVLEEESGGLHYDAGVLQAIELIDPDFDVDEILFLVEHAYYEVE